MRGLSRALAVLLFLVGALSVADASVAANPPATVTISSVSPRMFSPNGDGQEDTATVTFCLDSPANVTATIRDTGNTLVRTFASAQSFPAGCSYLAWDGRGDSGAVVADGSYDLALSAVNDSGTASTAAQSVVVERRVPGVVSAPAPGATVSGTASFVFTPTSGFTVTQGYFSVSGGGAACGSSWLSPEGDGALRWSVDTISCGDGAGSVVAIVYWTDSFGLSHGYSTVPVAVTLSNPAAPVPSIYGGGQTFSPNGDGQEDQVTVSYCVADTGDPAQELRVRVRVLDGAGAVVRTLVDESQTPTGSGSSCPAWYWQRWASWDGRDDAGAAVPDGSYVFKVEATDSTELTGSAVQPVVVERRVPGVVSAPAPGATVSGTASFVFTPTSGMTIARVDLGLASRGFSMYNASPDGLWRTTLPMGGLPQGPAELYSTAYWVDTFGSQHAYSRSFQVAIDPTSIALQVDPTVTTGIKPLDAKLTVTTSEPNSKALTVYVDWGDGTSPQSTPVSAPYAPLELTHRYAVQGAFTALVSVTNGEGGYAAQSTPITVNGSSNTPPTVTVTTTPTSGVAPVDTSTTITATDPDNDALTYKVDFGDGSVTATGAVTADAISHRYSVPGTYTVRTEVTDGTVGVVRFEHVTVALSEPLQANAGDDLVATTGQPVGLDGGGSRPAAAITRYSWDFGDGTTGADGNRVEHVYAKAGTYTATLTVAVGTQVQRDKVTVTVNDPTPEAGLSVTVTDGSAKLPATDLVVIDASGQRYSAVTGTDGIGHLRQLADGAYTVYAWKDGYTPQTAQAKVAGGTGAVSVALVPGQAATASVESKPLSYDEIVQAGIDPAAPENQHVYEFTVNLAFTPTVSVDVSGLAAGGSGGGGGGGSFYGVSVGGTSVTCSTVCPVSVPGFNAVLTVDWVGAQPQLLWLIIPGKASWLKEFFNVQMVVTNLASAGITLQHGVASLPLPAGLTLAPTAQPQSATVNVGDIPGGESANVSWVVRGDLEGFYPLSASYSGTLEPFGRSLSLSANLANPLHVWGGSALKMTVDVDSEVYDRYPYRVRVGLTNVADVPVYNASVELLKQGKLNYIYEPREALEQSTAEVGVGDTFWTDDYILAPEITGDLDLGHSFIKKTAGDVDVASTITSHTPLTTPDASPLAVSVGVPSRVALMWEPIPGATGYEVYRTADRKVDFGDAPVAVTTGSVTQAVAPTTSDDEAWYAISSIVNGRRTMLHPLVSGRSDPNGSTVTSDVHLSSQASCGNDVAVQLSAKDEYFNLASYRVELGDELFTEGALSGHEQVVSLPTITSAKVKAIGSRLSPAEPTSVPLKVTVVSQGGSHTDTVTVSVGCNPLKILVLGDSIAWGQGLNRIDTYAAKVKSKLAAATNRPVIFVGPSGTYAHSGAKVDASPGCDPDWRALSADAEVSGEVPVSTPDIANCQLAAAAAAGDAPDLVLVDGCINDVGVTNIFFNLNPFYSLSDDVAAKCGQPVTKMLSSIHSKFANAEVVYTGYYRIVDELSAPEALTVVASAASVPGAAVAKVSWQTAVSRAATFNRDFSSTAQEAVTSVGSGKVHFVDPLFPLGSGVLGLDAMLWDGWSDHVRGERAQECLSASDGLRLGWLDRNKCPFASLGHPNDKGADQYASQIWSTLQAWAATKKAKPSITGYAFTPPAMSIPRGVTKSVKVTASYSDGSTADATGLVTLASASPNVSVDSSQGTVTAVGMIGSSAQITATWKTNDVSLPPANLSVTVTAPLPVSVAVTPSNPLLLPRKKQQMKAVAAFTDGTSQDVTATSTWTSSNTAVATVTSAGLVTTVAVGSSAIRAVYSAAGTTVGGQTSVTVLSGAPKITSFSPSSGPAGTTVVLQGSNLLGATSVTVGGVGATFTVVSSSRIDLVVPASAKTGIVQVITPLGTAKSKDKFTVTP